jgi:hypothetical protein
VRVGDLVKCVPAGRRLGVIVAMRPSGPPMNGVKQRNSICDILIGGNVHPFLLSQLEQSEVISASR